MSSGMIFGDATQKRFERGAPVVLSLGSSRLLNNITVNTSTNRFVISDTGFFGIWLDLRAIAVGANTCYNVELFNFTTNTVEDVRTTKAFGDEQENNLVLLETDVITATDEYQLRLQVTDNQRVDLAQPFTFLGTSIDAAGGGGAVTSVFGRTGAVVAVAGDYAASQVTNDSTVAGANVDDALDTLSSEIGANRTVIYGLDWSANNGDYRTRSVGGSGNFNYSFIVPADFGSLVSLTAAIQPVGGAGGAGKDIDLFSEYGPVGSATNVNAESDVTSTYNLGTDGNNESLDISAVFSSLAAGHRCGINIDHNAIGGTVHYIGLILVYTPA